MKKVLLTLATVMALLVCGCEHEYVNPDNPNDTIIVPDEPTIDVTPYLGTFLMSRHTDLTITAMGLFTFPLDKDLDVEIVTIQKDPLVDNGIIISNNSALYLKGTVDEAGLHLQNDTIALAIDTTVASFPLNTTISVSMSHPVIPLPENGVLEWTSIASGTAAVTIPYLGPLSATITGTMRYRNVLR